jgi:hypothetical protein
MVYAPGDKMTWAEEGAKQVLLTGAEEKRVFTVMVSVVCDGTVLPFQSIYHGMSTKSCPSPSAPFYNEAVAAGFQSMPSRMKTYWSNQRTMQEYVNEVLEPYLERRK